MVNFHDVNGQPYVQQTSLSLSDIYAEPVPPTSVNDDPWSVCAVLEDAAGIGQPIVDSCLSHHKGEEKTYDQSHLDPIRRCSCMSCLLLGLLKDILLRQPNVFRDLPRNRESTFVCRFPGCQEQITESFGRAAPQAVYHERRHFGNLGEYHCLEGCQTTTKNFADLRRHYTVRHCTNAIKYPCPIVGCKYGGDNGFTRKDKLKSHHRNVHQGNAVPGKTFRAIKPKANEDRIIKPQGIQIITPKPSAGA